LTGIAKGWQAWRKSQHFPGTQLPVAIAVQLHELFLDPGQLRGTQLAVLILVEHFQQGQPRSPAAGCRCACLCWTSHWLEIVPCDFVLAKSFEQRSQPQLDRLGEIFQSDLPIPVAIGPLEQAVNVGTFSVPPLSEAATAWWLQFSRHFRPKTFEVLAVAELTIIIGVCHAKQPIEGLTLILANFVALEHPVTVPVERLKKVCLPLGLIGRILLRKTG
jgi:hypothetical protein